MAINLELIKELREKTGAGISDCKKALADSQGDLEKAIQIIREKGLATAAKKAERLAQEGLVEAYIHLNGRVGALVEINCETDFVAKTNEFRALAHDIALHIVGAGAQYLTKDAVPADIVAKEKEILETQAKNEGHTGEKLQKTVEERLNRFFSELCLMEQPFIRDPSKNITELIGEAVAKIGENIVIRRFVRYQLGEK